MLDGGGVLLVPTFHFRNYEMHLDEIHETVNLLFCYETEHRTEDGILC
jgi:hypothetical protein